MVTSFTGRVLALVYFISQSGFTFFLVTIRRIWRIVRMTYCKSTLLSFCLLTVLPLSSSAETNSLTADEKKAGWKLLFDGKSLGGWRNYQGKGVRDGWKVIDGTIQHTKNGGDIMTSKQYENFELKLEWKAAEGANSGIFLGVQETGGAIYESGIEMQILDNERHPDAKFEKHVSGACYGLYKPPAGADKKAGKWNQVRILKEDGHYQFFLNGVKTADFDMDSVDFINRIANSKFKKWIHFARYRKGHIGLQDHGDRVWFRNIKIKEIGK